MQRAQRNGQRDGSLCSGAGQPSPLRDTDARQSPLWRRQQSSLMLKAPQPQPVAAATPLRLSSAIDGLQRFCSFGMEPSSSESGTNRLGGEPPNGRSALRYTSSFGAGEQFVQQLVSGVPIFRSAQFFVLGGYNRCVRRHPRLWHVQLEETAMHVRWVKSQAVLLPQLEATFLQTISPDHYCQWTAESSSQSRSQQGYRLCSDKS